jgi:hypothetical protein
MNTLPLVKDQVFYRAAQFDITLNSHGYDRTRALPRSAHPRHLTGMARRRQ